MLTHTYTMKHYVTRYRYYFVYSLSNVVNRLSVNFPRKLNYYTGVQFQSIRRFYFQLNYVDHKC